MIPMLIGTAGRPLHAVFTAASGPRQRRAVVFCPSLNDEYTHTYRTGRLLAQRVAAHGAEALRFDYFGTGESAGEDSEFSVSGAVEDTLVAVDEVRDLAKVCLVTLVGLRAGALVAALAAPRSKAVDRLVLWDPVVDDYEFTGLPAHTLMLVSADTIGHRQLRAHLVSLENAGGLEVEVVECAPTWVAVGEDGIGPAPVEVLTRIAGWDP